MNARQFEIAVDNAARPGERARLESFAPHYVRVCDLDAHFVARIQAAKAARGEPPTKLRKSKRDEVAGYAKDAEDAEQSQTEHYAKLPARTIIYAMNAALEIDISFWGTQGLKYAHETERPIIEESLVAKRYLQQAFHEYLEEFPSFEEEA